MTSLLMSVLLRAVIESYRLNLTLCLQKGTTIAQGGAMNMAEVSEVTFQWYYLNIRDFSTKIFDRIIQSAHGRFCIQSNFSDV